jgi:hypothetical protein
MIGFDEDRYFGNESETAPRALADAERAEAMQFDEECAKLAREQVPLDGCETETI